MFDASAFERQRRLQSESFGVEPWNMEGDELKHYVSNMALALIVEVGEALQEVPWKSWSSKTRFDQTAYMNELIDAGHFLMNLMLIVTNDPAKVLAAYYAKAEVNEMRQAGGYDESGKCPTCGRE